MPGAIRHPDQYLRNTGVLCYDWSVPGDAQSHCADAALNVLIESVLYDVVTRLLFASDNYADAVDVEVRNHDIDI